MTIDEESEPIETEAEAEAQAEAAAEPETDTGSDTDTDTGTDTPVIVYLEPSTARMDDLGTTRVTERKFNDIREPGYIDFADQGGPNDVTQSFVEWANLALPPSQYRVTLRYANGRPASRDLRVFINGSAWTVLEMSQTGEEWDVWETRTFDLEIYLPWQLLTLRPIASAGGPNIDYIVIEDVSNEG